MQHRGFDEAERARSHVAPRPFCSGEVKWIPEGAYRWFSVKSSPNVELVAVLP